MTRQMKLISASVIVIVIALIAALLAYKYAPSKEVMELGEYFSVSGDEMAVLMQDGYSEERGYYIEGVPYLSLSMVKDNFNKGFYWDKSSSMLLYTKPDGVVKAAAESMEYIFNKNSTALDYVPVRIIGEQPYVAVPFVKEYSNIEYTAYENPNRIVITYDWGVNRLVTHVRKETVLRYEDTNKSPIIANLNKGDKLTCIGMDEEISGGYTKVITVDGVIGYVANKRIEESNYEVVDREYSEPQWTHIKKDYDICMAWHQVTNNQANEGLLTLLNNSKGVNTVSPTWFKISDNDGSISSLASERYVQRAHKAGVEVWGLCDDFSKEIDMSVILSNMTSREKLQSKLVSLAIEYDLDGINIDFENIPKEAGEDFVQFVREMSVRCRNNGIVLSINNYVPVEYRMYYDYEEQGRVADYVVIMAYDEHYSGSPEAGSVSSIGFVKDAVSGIIEKVAPEQVIMALPFYTRLWTVKNEGTEAQTIETAAYSMPGADSLLSDRKLEPVWDDVTGQYYAQYNEGDATNKIWLEDERSLEEKLKVVTGGGIRNVSFWRLGFEKSEVWNIVTNYINARETL
ncbi:MAG: glycosyl hydrolase family 18 [Lachnospiraceae bacterium]|nr:glycosyl hydrolase family 18 [Lachnospiraceae bacterium]